MNFIWMTETLLKVWLPFLFSYSFKVTRQRAYFCHSFLRCIFLWLLASWMKYHVMYVKLSFPLTAVSSKNHKYEKSWMQETDHCSNSSVERSPTTSIHWSKWSTRHIYLTRKNCPKRIIAFFRNLMRNMRAYSFYSKRAIASQYLGRRQLSQVFSAGGHGQAISRDHRAET